MQFIEKRKYFYIFSGILIIAGIISMLVQGFNAGIDFKGGSMLSYKITGSVPATDVQATVAKLGVSKDTVVQKSGNDYYIRTTELDETQTAKVTSGLKAKYNNVTYLSADSVGATIGSELTKNALLSVAIAIVLMLVYISFRFEWKFGVGAVVALFHDVLIVLGIFSLFHWQIDSSFVAAILTILGYSINDTIVIFDRVRENLKMKKKDELATLLNKSIMQTLNRSINTVLTALLPLITLFIFGGASIKNFVLAMLIGFIFGCYSSICIASPVYYELRMRETA